MPDQVFQQVGERRIEAEILDFRDVPVGCFRFPSAWRAHRRSDCAVAVDQVVGQELREDDDPILTPLPLQLRQVIAVDGAPVEERHRQILDHVADIVPTERGFGQPDRRQAQEQIAGLAAVRGDLDAREAASARELAQGIGRVGADMAGRNEEIPVPAGGRAFGRRRIRNDEVQQAPRRQRLMAGLEIAPRCRHEIEHVDGKDDVLGCGLDLGRLKLHRVDRQPQIFRRRSRDRPPRFDPAHRPAVGSEMIEHLAGAAAGFEDSGRRALLDQSRRLAAQRAHDLIVEMRHAREIEQAPIVVEQALRQIGPALLEGGMREEEAAARALPDVAPQPGLVPARDMSQGAIGRLASGTGDWGGRITHGAFPQC
jgi:hypothetical protein